LVCPAGHVKKPEGEIMEDTELEIKFRFINESYVVLLSETLKKVFPLNDICFTSREMENIYFDTHKLSLNKAYLTFRTRKIGERCKATVKFSDIDSESMLFERKEWEVCCENQEPSPELFIGTGAWDKLKKALSGRKLVELFKTEFTRSLCIFSPSPGVEIEISVDKGKIVSEEKELPILEMELEIKKGNIQDLIKASKKLVSVIPLLPEPLSKYERGAVLTGARTLKKQIRKILIPATGTLQEIFSQSIHRLLRCQNDFLIFPSDPDTLHHFRRALRSLRSITSFYRGDVDRSFREYVKTELGSLSRRMSKARELFVLKQYCLDSGLCGKEVINHIENEIRLETGKVHSYISSGKTTMLILDLLEGLASGAVEKEYKNFRKETIDLFDKQFKKLKKLAGRTDIADESKAHRFRIECRKLKNSMEIIDGTIHIGRSDLKRKLSKIQDETGKLHDIWRNIELTKELSSKYKLNFSKDFIEHLEKLLEKQRSKAVRACARSNMDVSDQKGIGLV
jgi:triphosphatase